MGLASTDWGNSMRRSVAEPISRRCVVVGALAGGVALATSGHRALARALIGASRRPTVVWETGAGASQLARLWTVNPGHVPVANTLRPQDSPERIIVVLPGRIIQLSSGHIVSLIATPGGKGQWRYGLADLQRVVHQGWHEASISVGSGIGSTARAVRALAGSGTQFLLLRHPVIRVPIRKSSGSSAARRPLGQ
jgi:hypothetical protein